MFNVGDKVIVKPDANKIKSRYLNYAKSMDKYLGREFRVKQVVYEIFREGVYYLTDDKHSDEMETWMFVENWLEPVFDNEINIEENDFEELLCIK